MSGFERKGKKLFYSLAVCLGWISLIVSSPAQAFHANYYYCNWLDNAIYDVKRDFLAYYQPDNLWTMGGFLASSAVFANTGLDKTIRDHWQTDIRRRKLNKALSPFNSMGRLSYYYIPIYLSAMSFGFWRDHSDLGNIIYYWGYRSLRTMLLGGLQQLALSPLLGGGRPEYDQPSRWQPFSYHNSVSAIAHYGAIPILTAAFMTDNAGFRAAIFALSTLPAVAAINKDKNYFSQALLGWGIALLSANAVYHADLAQTPPIQVGLQPRSNGMMLSASCAF